MEYLLTKNEFKHYITVLRKKQGDTVHIVRNKEIIEAELSKISVKSAAALFKTKIMKHF